LTPMLCSRLLKSGHDAHGAGSSMALLRWTNRAFARLQRGYANTLVWSLYHRRFIIMVFLASIAATVGMFYVIPLDFLPDANGDMVQVNTLGPTGISYSDMIRHQKEAEKIVQADRNVDGFSSNVNTANSGSMTLHLDADRELTE